MKHAWYHTCKCIDPLHVNAMLAGGGNVKIKNYPKGVTVTAPRVDVRDNMKHTPGGGNVKVSHL